MQLEMNNRQVDMDEKASRRAERLLRFSLSRFNGTVSRVKVTFSDVNGPQDGPDKRCRVTAGMNAAGRVMAQYDGHDYAEALSLCLDKIVRAIRRKVDMRRTGLIQKNRMNTKLLIDNASRVRPGSQAEFNNDEV